MNDGIVVSFERQRRERDGADEPPGETPPPSGEEGVPECPFTPLGFNRLRYYMLNAHGQLIGVQPKELTDKVLFALCGGKEGWLWKKFGTTNEQGRSTGWSAKIAAEWVIGECSDKGVFDPLDRVRGAGVWVFEPEADEASADDAVLVVNCGNLLYFTDANGRLWNGPPGLYGRHVYEAGNREMAPAGKPATVAEAAEIMTLLGTWRWARPEIDPVLLLGWVGAALIVGALDWRPSLWLTGDRGTGKSKLQKLVLKLLGSTVMTLAETTAAATRQLLRGAARPVTLDEIESVEDDGRLDAIVKLARFASTRGGGRVARGGQDGNATVSSIDACFLFSSIAVPSLAPADQQRITVLEIGVLAATPDQGRDVDRRVAEVARLGPALRRRMIDGWARLGVAMEWFQRRLSDDGHSSRVCDQIGSLLACAWVMCRDGEPESGDDVDAWCAAVTPGVLRQRGDDLSDHERCLAYLLETYCAEYIGGHRLTIGELVHRAAWGRRTNEAFESGEDPELRDAAQMSLRRCGLRVWTSPTMPRPRAPGDPIWLAVSNTHPGLAQLFAGTRYGSKGGRDGVWRDMMRRVDGARPSDRNITFTGQPTRAMIVPVFLDVEDDE